MEQKVIRNFKDFVVDITDDIDFVNDYKQFKTLLNNYWQNKGIYSTIEKASQSEAFATVYNNDGRFGTNKEIGKFRAAMSIKDNKCDFFYGNKQVTLKEIDNILNSYENENF